MKGAHDKVECVVNWTSGFNKRPRI